MNRTKQQIREDAKAVRSDLSGDAVTRMSNAIRENVTPLLDRYTTIMVYAAKEPEVETRDLIAGLLAGGKRIVVPIIERATCSLRLSYIDDLSVLVPGTFGVPEPLGSEIPADPAEIEVIVIPMLAFDRQGNRLGYGAGYYDRFLERCSQPVRIGIAYSCQEVERLPSEPDDVAMDFIVTEKAIITCQ
ncbi:5-formyltetrahydrofolate cyclo-ligase [Methanoculleus taiwanensis]|uniref:5-formyltetrahydrofolate cyclo-ligase n=1 Tax=Methanoculleus taiwanensis TaxID=1550565 RepID=A0A498H0J8_9EURY|nr:5-formyltetrahydrofolate cyclo-ligase [Methanoculleus taiwanensis]RXE56163.1 5-formyltetrahydrofolate cyclo-ligase [Methanoculleus taiwanensis]